MTEIEFLDVGEGVSQRRIAVLRRTGGAPGLFWLGGFRSDMTGSKAAALDAWGAVHGHAVTQFDYSGHGRSGGEFNDGTISRWLEDVLVVFETTTGPQIVMGSSMGAWIALLLVRALRQSGSDRVGGLVLIAPAVDMTGELMEAQFTKREQKQMATQGFIEQPSAYGEPYRITRALIEDGRQHLLFGRGIETGCPVTILQGGRDREVPKEHALKLVQHLLMDPVTFTLVPDGDHRLSRDEDLRLMEGAVERIVELVRSPPMPDQAELFGGLEP